jgi:hypothetical protein
MSATIYQFVPKPNPNRDKGICETSPDFIMDPTHYPDPPLSEYIASAGYPTDCGNAIWPGPEKDGA